MNLITDSRTEIMVYTASNPDLKPASMAKSAADPKSGVRVTGFHTQHGIADSLMYLARDIREGKLIVDINTMILIDVNPHYVEKTVPPTPVWRERLRDFLSKHPFSF
jgi:hypothetical protein